MDIKTDHTGEVERRIAAIRISPCDSCSFFRRKDSALVNLHQCFYCAYGIFEKEGVIRQLGLCKYKR